MHLEPVFSNKRSHHNEKPAHHNWRVDPAHHKTGESSCSSGDPAQSKINRYLLYKHINIYKCIKRVSKKKKLTSSQAQSTPCPVSCRLPQIIQGSAAGACPRDFGEPQAHGPSSCRRSWFCGFYSDSWRSPRRDVHLFLVHLTGQSITWLWVA